MWAKNIQFTQSDNKKPRASRSWKMWIILETTYKGQVNVISERGAAHEYIEKLILFKTSNIDKSAAYCHNKWQWYLSYLKSLNLAEVCISKYWTLLKWLSFTCFSTIYRMCFFFHLKKTWNKLFRSKKTKIMRHK